jgi:hypothetical protein
MFITSIKRKNEIPSTVVRLRCRELRLVGRIANRADTRSHSNGRRFIRARVADLTADRAAFIDMVIAWSPQRENPVLQSFLELARKSGPTIE